MNELNILIADTDPDFCKFTARELKHSGLYGHIYTTDNMKEALDCIQNHKIRILITDFLINRGSGLSLIQKLKQQDSSALVLLCSTLLKDDLINRSVLLDADTLIAKPCTPSLVQQEVVSLLQNGSSPSSKIQYLEAEVAQMLRESGLPTKGGGYRYMKQAIIMTILAPTGTDGITKVIYPEIARMYQSKPKNVERSIRYLIEANWDEHRREKWGRFLSEAELRSERHPSNAAVISAIAEYYRLFREKTNIRG